MSNNQWWVEPPSKRLSAWRNFRQSLDTTDITDVCKTVMNWWENAPLLNITIDPVDSNSWPTPWEMLHRVIFVKIVWH